MLHLDSAKIGIIGLGYVGLPLAVELARHFDVIGFDINAQRVAELTSGHDRTLEVPDEALLAPRLAYHSDESALADCTVYIITVPTPIDSDYNPDLRPLVSASELVARHLKHGDIVIYESTVYPGTTEEICVPRLEAGSGLIFNQDFFCGYSPERINPGDHARRLPDIVKVTSGSTPASADFVDALYRRIITAGTHRAPSMRVAEAAKVIENIQRDVNIALVNELALIFDRLDIDTRDVLDAAGSKWNFLPFRPGLVGGHCIGVDPYYLLHKSEAVGYHPALIQTARQINNRVGSHVGGQVLGLLAERGIAAASARILVLGITFKENCPDLRNSRVMDVIHCLQNAGAKVDVYDPWADADEVQAEYGIPLLPELPHGQHDAVILAVAHDAFRAFDAAQIHSLGTENSVIYDIKSIWPRTAVSARL